MSKVVRILLVYDCVLIGFCRNICNGKIGGVVVVFVFEIDEMVFNNIDFVNIVVVVNFV